MGRLQIPNTSVVYDNPKQVDQSSVKFPDCGDTGKYPPNFPSRTGRVWQREPVNTGVPGPFPVSTDFPGPAVPQPGTFEAPPNGNPVLFNAQPASLSSGGISIPNSSCVVKNPA